MVITEQPTALLVGNLRYTQHIGLQSDSARRDKMSAVYLKFRLWLLGFSLVVLGLSAALQIVNQHYWQASGFVLLVLLLIGLDLWVWRPSERPRLTTLSNLLSMHDGLLQLDQLQVRQSDIVRIETGFIDQQRAYLLLHCYEQAPKRLYFPTSELEQIRQWLAAHLDSRLLTQADFHLL